MKRENLRQNNKGFSLVELIIVMAILAILVGAIAPQVISYVEQARERKDLQMVDTVFSACQTAIAEKEVTVANISGDLDVATTAVPKIKDLLKDDIETVAGIQGKAKSKKGQAGKLYVVYDSATGALSVYIGTAVGSPTIGPVTN